MMILSRRLTYILAFESLLFIPLFAMLFTTEVNWKQDDFALMAILLLLLALGVEFSLRKFKRKSKKWLSLLFISFLFLLIWAEFAVGIFGTSFAGS